MEAHLTPVSAFYKNSYGHKIVNGYTIIDKLGQGSFGKVKVCTREGAQFAVKIFNKAILRRRREFMKNDRGGMKFHTALDDVMREIEVMKRLTHKNVVRLIEVLDDQEREKLYLVVDYCAKGALLNWDSNQRKFSCPFLPQLQDADIRLLLRGMILGLDYRMIHSVHYNCIAHRDIKPQNILVTAENVVKICDFGQAMLCEDGDLTMKTVGTIQFFPPECCGSKNLRTKGADIWAAGLTLYSLVFKELPFFAETFLEVMEAIQRFQLSFKKPVSREIRYFLERMLDPNPVTRAKIWQLVQHPWIAKPVRGQNRPDSNHHCAFVGYCIGARNYKAFMLFLVYVSAGTSIYIYALYQYLFMESIELAVRSSLLSVLFWTGNVAVILSALLVTSLLMSHLLFIMINVTSIEYKKGKPVYSPGYNPTDKVTFK